MYTQEENEMLKQALNTYLNGLRLKINAKQDKDILKIYEEKQIQCLALIKKAEAYREPKKSTT